MADQVDNPLTFATAILGMCFDETPLSKGSGFFWLCNDTTFLITNWHNVTGRNAETKKPLSPTAAIPNRIEFSVYKAIAPAGARDDEYVDMHAQALQVSLYTSDGKPLWLEHPLHGGDVDVVAIPLQGMTRDEFHFEHANVVLAGLKRQPKVAQDAYVVGYPLGLIAGIPIPIWKRATIATEPNVDINGLPKMLVDTATREGMSGSLVVAKHFIFGPYQTSDGTVHNSVFAIRDTILGVYSGRLGQDQVQAQLGIVWKVRVIEEILSAAFGPPAKGGSA